MTARRAIAVALASAALLACDTAPAGSGGDEADARVPATGDSGPRDVPDAARPVDAGGDDGGANDDASRPDVLVDDGFTRPDLGPAPDTGGTADATADAVADAPDDAAADAAPDVADPPDSVGVDTDRDFSINVSGSGDCLAWSITSPYDTFDFKGDIFTVLYDVRNTCPETMLFRVEHFNDFFPIALHKDGEFWTYLGNCPGEGPEHEWTFRTRDEGITRGFTWQAENHERLLTQCGVEYDPDASYELVGYGSTPLTTFEPLSERYQLTEPIPILILD